jgi:hypothetical protein
MCVTELGPEPDADITKDEMPGQASSIGQYAGVAWGRAGRRDQDPAEDAAGAATVSGPRQSIRSRISRTRSIVVCGCRNANRATVSPSHADGGMKAT